MDHVSVSQLVAASVKDDQVVELHVGTALAADDVSLNKQKNETNLKFKERGDSDTSVGRFLFCLKLELKLLNSQRPVKKNLSRYFIREVLQS